MSATREEKSATINFVELNLDLSKILKPYLTKNELDNQLSEISKVLKDVKPNVSSEDSDDFKHANDAPYNKLFEQIYNLTLSISEALIGSENFKKRIKFFTNRIVMNDIYHGKQPENLDLKTEAYLEAFLGGLKSLDCFDPAERIANLDSILFTFQDSFPYAERMNDDQVYSKIKKLDELQSEIRDSIDTHIEFPHLALDKFTPTVFSSQKNTAKLSSFNLFSNNIPGDEKTAGLELLKKLC